MSPTSLWDDKFTPTPAPIWLELLGWTITINPVEDYPEVAQRLLGTHGSEPTALVRIERLDDLKRPLRDFEELVDELLYGLRLVTGNHVDWFYCEAGHERDGKPSERIHKYGVSAGYSDVMRFRPLNPGQTSAVPKLIFSGLVEAFFRETERHLSGDDLYSLINQFTNACEPSLNVESIGLLASTLSELIAAKYSQSKGISNIIPEAAFKGKVFPFLKDAIEKIDLPSESTKRITEHLRGVYRSSLADKLGSLNEDLNLGLKPEEINRIVSVRNSLVHRGTYPAPSEDGTWYDDYELMIWTNFIALCRLSGYDGELPRFQDWQRLGV